MKDIKSMTLNELIERLTEIRDHLNNGDAKVMLSGDPEGNDYSTIDKGDSFVTHDEQKDLFFIYPYEQFGFDDIF